MIQSKHRSQIQASNHALIWGRNLKYLGRTEEADDTPYPETGQKETKMATTPAG